MCKDVWEGPRIRLGMSVFLAYERYEVVVSAKLDVLKE